MRLKDISSLIRLSAMTAAALVAMVVAGCQSDDMDEQLTLPTEGIEFGARVSETSDAQTRALETKNITSDPYDMDFFIELNYTPEGGSETSEIKTYRVPQGEEGRLKATDESLMWKHLKRDHTFNSWNMPWDKEYVASTNSVELEFKDSPEGDEGYKKWTNNIRYQHFLGARSGPYSYNKNGQYVPITFRHLVSKIRIGTFMFMDGVVTQKNIKGNITFIGMPHKATFHPHPTDESIYEKYKLSYKDPYQKFGPVVLPNELDDPDEGVTFFINNGQNVQNQTIDEFYICPELNFDDIIFKIEVTSAGDYYTGGDYYGSFRDVAFDRIGTDTAYWDRPERDDEKILHAGEMMTLNITLIPGGGPGMTVKIEDWSTEQPRTTSHHSHPGIYSDGEAQDLISVFGRSYTPEEAEALYALYGDGTDESTNRNIFKMYEDVTVNGNSFPIGKDYILYGMGHTITMTGNSKNTVTVGYMVDVYITDGKNTIYIDSNGKIWIKNQTTGEFTATNNQLNKSNTSFTITLTTGAVTQS